MYILFFKTEIYSKTFRLLSAFSILKFRALFENIFKNEKKYKKENISLYDVVSDSLNLNVWAGMFQIQSVALYLERDLIGFGKFNTKVNKKSSLNTVVEKISVSPGAGAHFLYKAIASKHASICFIFTDNHFDPLFKKSELNLKSFCQAFDLNYN